ncbi:hypothetical protein GCM10010452_40380 [Crossiella cryophila]
MDTHLIATVDDGLPLHGTLTLPTGPGPHPAVLLLPGSGRPDRDANTKRTHTAPGPPLATGDWRSTGFLGNQRDAAAAPRVLAGRAGIRADVLGVVGHSGRRALDVPCRARGSGGRGAARRIRPSRGGGRAVAGRADHP